MMLDGRYVMVSGIGPGLGAKLVRHAALQGAAGIAISAWEDGILAEAERTVREIGRDVAIVTQRTDIREADQCRAFAEATVERFGRIDALINNGYVAGGITDRATTTTDFSEWTNCFETNVIGTVKMCQAVIPQMTAQGDGSIVMINTVGSKMVPPVDQAGYCASKAALYNVTRRLAFEVGPDNIRVNSVHPGFMWGVPVQSAMPIFGEWWGGEEKAYEFIKNRNALRRIITDDEVAYSALFLASSFSSGMTGSSLDLNGGAYLP